MPEPMHLDVRLDRLLAAADRYRQKRDFLMRRYTDHTTVESSRIHWRERVPRAQLRELAACAYECREEMMLFLAEPVVPSPIMPSPPEPPEPEETR